MITVRVDDVPIARADERLWLTVALLVHPDLPRAAAAEDLALHGTDRSTRSMQTCALLAATSDGVAHVALICAGYGIDALARAHAQS